jgi:hypothetical protein
MLADEPADWRFASKGAALNPSLSVLLPLYNAEQIAEPLILDAIEVLPDLTGRFDIVVIDDGSTDDTANIATGLAARFPQVRILHHARRMGALNAARTGLAISAGEMVLWRDEVSTAGVRGIHRLWRVLPGQDLACGRHQSSTRTGKRSQPAPTTQLLPELYLARREVFEALPWPPADRASLERELHLRGFRWTEIPLPAQIAGIGQLPMIDPMFRQLADQSQRVGGMFQPSGNVHAPEEHKAPNFLGKLRTFALGE